MLTIILAALALAAPDAPPGGTVVRLGVRPMAAPKPALRYHLLPEVRDLQAGNPVQWYLRCFAEQRFFFFNKEIAAERTRYQTMPLKELPADKLKGYGGSALTQADWGARLDTPDWQVIDRVQKEGSELQLPELGPLLSLGTALQVRFRGEVARGDFDAAIRTAQTMFAFARHFGEHPTTAANRTGIAVADMAIATLQEMIQQPGCPNLYWALTDLPGSIVEIRKGVHGDRAAILTELRPFRDDVVMSDKEIDELMSRLSGRSGYAREQAGQPPRNLRAVITAQVKDAERVRAAREHLIEAGIKRDLVGRFPPLQVILLDEKRTFESRYDDELKLHALPPWQIDAIRTKSVRSDNLFADLLSPAVELRQAQGRLEQRIAMLRIVEAIRLYAADHGGKAPASLDDVAAPLPVDPFTGKTFDCKVEGDTVRIRGAAPKSAAAVEYEVSIKK